MKNKTKLYPKHEQLVKEAEERDKFKKKLHNTMDKLNISFTKATIRMIDEDLKKYDRECSPEFKRSKKYKDGVKLLKGYKKEYLEEVKNDTR